MSAKSGIVGGIYIQGSTPTTFTDKAATLQADNKTVIITDTASVGFVRDASLFVVKKGGSAVLAPYEIHFDRIIFQEEQTAGTWTISGTKSDMAQVGGAYDWNIDIKQSVQETSCFGETWESKIKGLLSWSGSCKRRYLDTNYIDVADNGTPLVFRFFTDIDTPESYICYGYIDGIKDGTKVDGVTDGELSFSGDGSVIFASYAV